MSPALTRLLAYANQLPEYKPATLDDAAEVLGELDDTTLALVCKQPPGLPVVVDRRPSLSASCQLRWDLEWELIELEFPEG